MPGIIDKGTITNINGNKVRVSPCDASACVSAQLTIPWHLRTKSGNLEKGTEVVYVRFDDQTGLLLGRMDGDWGDWLPVLTIGGNLTVGGAATVTGAVSTGGGVTTPADVSAGGISLKTHRHGGVETGPGNTGTPQ